MISPPSVGAWVLLLLLGAHRGEENPDIVLDDRLHIGGELRIGTDMVGRIRIWAAELEELPPFALEQFGEAAVMRPAVTVVEEALDRGSQRHDEAEGEYGPSDPLGCRANDVEAHQRRDDDPAGDRDQPQPPVPLLRAGRLTLRPAHLIKPAATKELLLKRRQAELADQRLELRLNRIPTGSLTCTVGRRYGTHPTPSLPAKAVPARQGHHESPPTSRPMQEPSDPFLVLPLEAQPPRFSGRITEGNAFLRDRARAPGPVKAGSRGWRSYLKASSEAARPTAARLP